MHVALLGANETIRSTLAEALQAALPACRIAPTCTLLQCAHGPLPDNLIPLQQIAAAHRQDFALTLLLAPTDAAQATVTLRLRAWLLDFEIPFASIFGSGAMQTANAQAAMEHLARAVTGPAEGSSRWHWNCENCSDAACEHRLFAALLR